MKTFFLAIVFLFSIKSFCQNTQWQSLTTADGLSHSYIYQIYQTRDGYLWISTNGGINRYDGYNFKVFRNSPQDSLTISDDRTKAILEDKQGRLWVTTQSGGLNLFDRQTQKCYHADVILPKYSTENNITGWRLLQDANGSIWMGGSMSTIFKITIPKKWGNGYPEKSDFKNEIEIKAIELKDEIKDLKHLLIDGNILWVGSSNGRVFSYHTKTGQIKEFSPPTRSGLGDPSAITGFYKNAAGHLIISTMSEGIYEVKNGVVNVVFSPSQKTDFWLDDKGFVWLKNAENQVFRVHWNSLSTFNPVTQKPVFISKSRSYKSFLNIKNNIVFIGDVRGIKKVNLQEKPFKHILAETDNYFVFQTKNGRTLVRNGNIISDADEKSLGKPAFKEFTNGKMYQAKNGTVWVVTDKEPMSLLKYDENLRFIKEFPLKDYGIKHHPVFNEDRTGKLLIAAVQGTLILFDPVSEQSKTYSYKNLLPETSHVHLGEAFSVFEGNEGSIWIAMEDGIVEGQRFQNQLSFKIYSSKNSPLKGSNFQFAVEDPYQPDHIWVSTKEAGLQKWQKRRDVKKILNLESGLPDLRLMGLLEDSQHNFWASCTKGIYKLNPKTFEIKAFRQIDGLQGEIFNEQAFHQSQNGKMLFSGNNGVNIFNPDSIISSKESPNLKISKLEVNNKTVEVNDESEILEKSIEQLDEINLEYSQNTIKLFFGILDFSNPQTNIYRYQLEGLDKNLVEAGTEHTATYVSLPVGSYIFKLYGSVRGGEWNKEPVLLKINVLPPWYRTWWAYLLYFSIIAYIAYRFYQFQINKVKLNQELEFEHKEKERLAELDQMKTKFFTNISHEFRTPLTLLVGPIDDLKKKYPQESIIAVMQRNLQRLQSLINQLLDLSKLESGEMKVNLQEVDLTKFLEQLFASFESLAQSKNIIFNHSQSKINQFAIADIDKLEKITSNLLSNAFKFTPENGRIVMRIDYFDNNLNLKISDSGIGIEKEKLTNIFDRFYQVDDDTQRLQEGTGVGLALVKELVEVLGGNIKVSSKLGEGTTFDLILPFTPIEKLSEKSAEFIYKKTAEIDFVESNISTESKQINSEQPIMLIVEDNPDLRSYISSVFEGKYQIITAKDGLEGLEKAIEFVPDIVISDLMMPKLDGLSFCEKLRNDERINHIPVIMLTAKASIADRLIGLERGADDYLSKPFNKEELTIRVNNLVSQRALLRDKFSSKTVDKIETIKEPTIDELFIQKAKTIIDKNLNQSAFDVEAFADSMNLSSVQLRRKLKAITDFTVTEFVRNYRLEKAAEMLKKGNANVSEIAFEVGFESLSYFSKVFQEKFGKMPSEWK